MPRLYIGMDGVLCDFVGAAEAVLGMSIADFRALHGEQLMWLKLERTPDFYETLPWLDEGRKLWDVVASMKPKPLILTGLPLGGWAKPQKRAWCARELGMSVPVVACLQREKRAMCTAGDILIDNDPLVASAWVRAGGWYVQHRAAETSLEAIDVIRSGQPGGGAERVPTPQPVVRQRVFRSAGDGRFVARSYADAHPETTVAQMIER